MSEVPLYFRMRTGAVMLQGYLAQGCYRGTWLIRQRKLLGPCSSPMARALR